MADVDELQIKIDADAKKAIAALDALAKKLGVVQSGLSNLAKESGIQNISNAFEKAVPGITKLSKNADELQKRFANLGKNFQFAGPTKSLEKQIEKYTNALEAAKLKKEELEASGKTGGAAYEDAIRNVTKYSNILESLKSQLEKINSAQQDFDIKVNLGDSERTLESFVEQLKDFDKIVEAGGAQTAAGLSMPTRGLELSLETLRSLFPEAQELIASYEAEIERAKSLSVDVPSMQYGNIDLSAFERLGEQIGVNSDRVKAFGERLSQLVVPDIQEENLEKLYSELNKAEQKVEELRTKLANNLTMGTVTESIDDSGYRNLQTQIAYTEKSAEALREKIAEVESQSANVGGVSAFGAALAKLSTLGQAAQSGLSLVGTGVKKIASAIGAALSKLKSFAKSIMSLTKSSGNLNNSFLGGFKNILKYSLGISSLYMLFNKLRSAITEGFKNLAVYSEETNASLSLLKNSMTQFKNASAAAVAPLLNAFAPALNQIIQLCVKAANAINQLLSSLLGKNTWVKAKTLTDSYAASIQGAGKKAEKAGEKIQKGVRPFDELKTINLQEDSAESGGGASSTPAADMFETVPIESKFSDFAERIKQMWANADFTELGVLFGTKLKNALENIDWGSIQETAARIGQSLGTFINGAVQVDGLAYTIGSTVGNAINTGISFVNNFLDTANWSAIGAFIGNGLNGLVETISWEGIGHLFAQKFNAAFSTIGEMARTFDWSNFGLELSNSVNTFVTDFNWAENGANLGELIKGLLDTILSFLENTDWQALGNGIADFIGGIDWGGIIERLAEGIGAALGGLASLLWGLIQDAWNSVVTWWQETAFQDGEFTITGLLNGIWEKIKDIGTWIYDHIFKPFVDGFKKAFGIASPSKVMEEQGSFLMQGLFGGVSSLIEKVVGVFSNLKEKILNIWNILKERTTAVWNNIKDAIKVPVNAILGFINGLVGGVESGLNFMINALNKLHFDVPDWVPVIGGGTFGFNIPTIDIPEIPYLAKGGVAWKKTLAVIGEDGQEGVVPLENQSALQKIANAISVPLLNNLKLSSSIGNYEIAKPPEISSYMSYGNMQGQMAMQNNWGGSSFAGGAIEEAAYRGFMRAMSDSDGMSANVTFQVEGDPNGIFRVWRQQWNEQTKRTKKNPVIIYDR